MVTVYLFKARVVLLFLGLSNVPATFTVNPDCTGSKTIGATTYNFVITPDGSKITWIVTSNGVTMTGTGVRSLYLKFGD